MVVLRERTVQIVQILVRSQGQIAPLLPIRSPRVVCRVALFPLRDILGIQAPACVCLSVPIIRQWRLLGYSGIIPQETARHPVQAQLFETTKTTAVVYLKPIAPGRLSHSSEIPPTISA